MLSISGVAGPEQAELAKQLITEFDADGNHELRESEQRAFRAQLKEGLGPVDAMLDANNHLVQPLAVLDAVAERACEQVRRRRCTRCCWHFC